VLHAYLANLTAVFGTALDVFGDRQISSLACNRVVDSHELDVVSVAVGLAALGACALYSLDIGHQW